MAGSNFEIMLNNGTFASVAEYANLIAEAASKENFFGEGCTGGVMTFLDPVNQGSIQFNVGPLSPENATLYGKFSLEKPKRGVRMRAKNSYIDAEHNPEEGRYAGAFDIRKLNIWESFSGFKQFDDVVFGAHSLYLPRIIDRAQMLNIFYQHGEKVSKDLRYRQGELAEIYGN